MTCLDAFPQAADSKVSVSLNAKDHISCCKCDFLTSQGPY